MERAKKICSVIFIIFAISCCIFIVHYIWTVSFSNEKNNNLFKKSYSEEDEDENSLDSYESDSDYPSSIAFDFKLHKNYHLFNDGECGITRSYRILGGNETEILSHPWQVALKYSKKNTTVVSCGGSLISENLVLTAAHCIDSSLVSVVLGEHDLSTAIDCQSSNDGSDPICVDPAQEIKDFDTLTHHKYTPKLSHHYDIALIKLKNPVKMQQENIGTVCLPFTFSEIPVKNLAVMGWGNTIPKMNSKSNLLLGTKLPFVNKTDCKKFITLSLIESQFCAGGEHGKDSCKGDSGGPVTFPQNVEGIARAVQFGIVSYGPICGTAPGVYTKVNSFLRWILDNA